MGALPMAREDQCERGNRKRHATAGNPGPGTDQRDPSPPPRRRRRIRAESMRRRSQLELELGHQQTHDRSFSLARSFASARLTRFRATLSEHCIRAPISS